VIVFLFSKLLQWLYGWEEITYETKCILTCISGLECFVFVMIVSMYCSIELPGILKERKKKKEQSK
jgi:hypothetical protein